jgi:hypothetical protein
MPLASVHVSGLPHLLQLTGLKLDAYGFLEFHDARPRRWACHTSLQSLALRGSTLHPGSLEDLTQLQLLSINRCGTTTRDKKPYPGCEGLVRLLTAVSKLLLLTELRFYPWHNSLGDPPAAAFTALTASTNLCSLQLSLPSDELRRSGIDSVPGLFTQGMAYTRLRLVSLYRDLPQDSLPASEEVLRQLCSCCPAVESLAFAVDTQTLAQALEPLLQLSALTCLELHKVGRAVGTAVGVAAQLTGLKCLKLHGFTYEPQDASSDTHSWHAVQPVLLQLTALTALEQRELKTVRC